MGNANNKARESKVEPEVRKATRNRPLSIPSRKPSVLIVLATPYSKHFANPSEAEMTEVMKVA